jgi:hypothetical protein
MGKMPAEILDLVLHCWDEFLLWCKKEGIDLETSENWELWWSCWRAAIDCYRA